MSMTQRNQKSIRNQSFRIHGVGRLEIDAAWPREMAREMTEEEEMKDERRRWLVLGCWVLRLMVRQAWEAVVEARQSRRQVEACRGVSSRCLAEARPE